MIIMADTMVQAFYELITEAQQCVGVKIDQEVESFAVYALLRNVQHTQLKEIIFAQELLSGIARKNAEELEKVLDCSLIYAGWYPKRAQKLGLSHTYFSDIGKTASLELAYYYRMLKSSYQRTYTQIFTEFDKLVMLLQSFLTLQEVARVQQRILPANYRNN